MTSWDRVQQNPHNPERVVGKFTVIESFDGKGELGEEAVSKADI